MVEEDSGVDGSNEMIDDKDDASIPFSVDKGNKSKVQDGDDDLYVPNLASSDRAKFRMHQRKISLSAVKDCIVLGKLLTCDDPGYKWKKIKERNRLMAIFDESMGCHVITVFHLDNKHLTCKNEEDRSFRKESLQTIYKIVGDYEVLKKKHRDFESHIQYVDNRNKDLESRNQYLDDRR